MRYVLVYSKEIMREVFWHTRILKQFAFKMRDLDHAPIF